MARTKKYFNKIFGKEYELEFYAVPEGFRVLKRLPYELIACVISFLPYDFDNIVSSQLKSFREKLVRVGKINI
jgi:hypothetical protein